MTHLPDPDSATDAQRPVLVILHQATSTPGRVGQMLTARGVKLDIRRPALGDALPDSTRDYGGCVIFGGPMSANDTDAFIKREIDFINVPLRDETPFLGICLGGQMLAKTIGGTVGPHHAGQVEIGYYDLDVTPEGEKLMEWPKKVYQWHREGFEVPAGAATLLAVGQHYEQAFRVGPNAYGLQFHPELTLAMMHRWTTRGHERMKLPGARQRADHFHGRAIYDPPVKAWLSSFLDIWLASGTEKAKRSAAAEQAAA